MYKKRIAHLVGLISQIKEYKIKEMEEILSIEKVEKLLDRPEVSDREWEKMPIEYQRIFDKFLITHIDVYKKVIEELKKKVIE